MDQNYLQELISEAENRGGGLILNDNEKPAVVVLTIDRYNQLALNAQPMENVQVAEVAVLEKKRQPLKVLVTGGAGYVGSHVVRELIKAGYEPVVLDNLSTGKIENVPQGTKFFEGDVSDVNLLRDLFATENFYAVFHFAGSTELAEELGTAQQYLENNTLNTATLLSVMQEANVSKLIFSSSAQVYGEQDVVPVPETAKLSPKNSYGYSKLLAERLIKYYCHFSGLRAVVFRYCTACGVDVASSATCGQQGDLLQELLSVAKGKQPFVGVRGSGYATHDGTLVRDFSHVSDVARAHVLGLKVFEKNSSTPGNYDIFNVGSGKGRSVLEVISKASEVLSKIIPMEMQGGNSDAVTLMVTDNSKIQQELGFMPVMSDLENIITTTWAQMKNN